MPYPEDIQVATQDPVFQKLSRKKLQDFYKRLKQYRSELQTLPSDSNLAKRKEELVEKLRLTNPYFAHLVSEKGKDASYRGVPLLLLAVRDNIPELAELMILNGADTTIRNDWNETLLHIAAQNNSVPMIRLLLNAGVRIDILGNAEYNYTTISDHIFRKY